MERILIMEITKVIKKIGKGNLRRNSRKFAKKKENYNVKA